MTRLYSSYPATALLVFFMLFSWTSMRGGRGRGVGAFLLSSVLRKQANRGPCCQHPSFGSSSSSSSSQSRLWMSTTTTTVEGGEQQQPPSSRTGDLLITGLNGPQDIMVRVVSCRELVQDCILKLDLSPQSAKALGEVVVSTLMMGSGLKDQETLQVNLVGNNGLGNVMAITDGDLKVRGMVGNPRFSKMVVNDDDIVPMRDLLGDGQVQVVRNHPSYKRPMNGIVLLRDVSIPLNLAFYMAESEQKSAVLLTDVKVEGNLCRHALGVMVERLPGATEDSIETSIKNLAEVEQKGLRAYLTRTDAERQADGGMFRDFSTSLDKIMDDCLVNMREEDSIRWSKHPSFRCSCGVEKVWRTLRLLPLDDVRHILEHDGDVSMKCDFCGEKYMVKKEDVINEILGGSL